MGIQIFNAQPFQGLRARCADHGAGASGRKTENRRQLTMNLMDQAREGCATDSWSECESERLMLQWLMTKLTSAALGGYGVFSAISSFSEPTLVNQAVILLCLAAALAYLTDQEI
jgi:hypothetical protein